jgi:hypothetical protein
VTQHPVSDKDIETQPQILNSDTQNEAAIKINKARIKQLRKALLKQFFNIRYC